VLRGEFSHGNHHPFPRVGADVGCLSTFREEVQGIFEPIIQEVIKLVDGQIQAVQNKGKQVTVRFNRPSHTPRLIDL